MNKFVKFAALAAVAGACTIATALPSQAAGGRNAAAAIGFGAGAAVGAATAGSYYNGPGYAERSYAYSPSECRMIIRHHLNRFGERVTVRERVCD
jgi:hypothetical protein